MAFAYTSGIATSVADWFSIFEAWITGTVGWTIASGSGTEDLVLSSEGEAADKTMLFAHIWQGSSTDAYKIYGEVQDDAVGTHVTTRGGYISGLAYAPTGLAGAQAFRYWMTADKNAIVISSRTNGFNYYWTMYLGLVEPFALSVLDETYLMIATSTVLTNATVLRNAAGTWDFNTTCNANDYAERGSYDLNGNSYWCVGSLLCGVGDAIIGQLYHIGNMFVPGSYIPLAAEDTCTSVLPGGTATWIILRAATSNVALRTGGTLSSDGVDDGEHYAYTTGTANSISEYFGILRTLLGQVGWNETDFSGTSGYTEDWLFDSAGESGNETIYIRMYWRGTASQPLYMVIQDDANYTPAHSSLLNNLVYSTDLPATFHIIADRDCIYTSVYKLVSSYDTYRVLWGGLVINYLPDIPTGSEYKIALIGSNISNLNEMRCIMLRTHDGNWTQEGDDQLFYGDSILHNDDNPNELDGVTYIIWPELIYDFNPGYPIANDVPYGRAKYLFHIDNNNIEVDDTLTIDTRTYTVLLHMNNSSSYRCNYAIRTDGGMYSSSSSSSSFSSSSSSST